jgi:O-antigen/teichoic acid export membrane protein
MGVIRKQALGNMIITYVGLVISAINVLWLLPKGMIPEEVGLRSIILSSAFLVSPLARIGFTKVIIKFYPHFKSREKKDHGFLFFILVIPLFGFILMLILFLLLKSQIIGLYSAKAALIGKYIWYLIPLSFIIMYNGIISTYCLVNLKVIVPSVIQQIIMPLFTTFLLFMMNIRLIDFSEFMMLMVLSILIGAILNLIYLKYLKLFHIKPDFSLLNKKMLKEMIIYGFFVIIGGVGAIISTNISTLMLGAMQGLKQTAIFSIAYYIGTVIDVPRGSLSRISSPFIAEAWHKNQLTFIDKLYKKTAINQMIVGCFAFLLIWMNIDNIFHIIPRAEIYQNGKWVVFYIGLAKVIDMTTGINTEIIINSDKYKFNFIAVISFTILIIILNYLLIPVYGIQGAAIAIMVSFIYFNLIKFIYLWAVFKLQPFSFNFLKVLIIATIVYLVVCFLPVLKNPIYDIALKSIAIFILFLGSVLLSKASEDIQSFTKSFIGILANNSSDDV